MSISIPCCTHPAVKSNYKPIGTHELINNGVKVYKTGTFTSSKALICVYDIFGFHANTMQFCDLLGEITGFRVIMPDFFKGSPWSMDKFPPQERQDLIDWCQTSGSWENVVKPILLEVIQTYKRRGIIEFGIFGFCWGSKMSVLAVSDIDFKNFIHAAGLIHPSFVETEDARNVQFPILLLPSQTENDMIPFQKAVQTKLGPSSCEHKRFDDMIHGFASARGDFNDELVRKRIQQVILLLKNFFEKHLKA